MFKGVGGRMREGYSRPLYLTCKISNCDIQSRRRRSELVPLCFSLLLSGRASKTGYWQIQIHFRSLIYVFLKKLTQGCQIQQVILEDGLSEQGCWQIWNRGGAHIKPFLKKWVGTMLSNQQKVVGHVSPGPTYGDTLLIWVINPAAYETDNIGNEDFEIASFPNRNKGDSCLWLLDPI